MMISVIGIAVILTTMITVPAMYFVMYFIDYVSDIYYDSVREAGGVWYKPDWLTEGTTFLGRNAPFGMFCGTMVIHVMLVIVATVKCNSYMYQHYTFVDSWVGLWVKGVSFWGPVVGWILVGIGLVFAVNRGVKFLARVNVALEKTK